MNTVLIELPLDDCTLVAPPLQNTQGVEQVQIQYKQVSNMDKYITHYFRSSWFNNLYICKYDKSMLARNN